MSYSDDEHQLIVELPSVCVYLGAEAGGAFAGVTSFVQGILVYLEPATCESSTFSIFRKCEAAKRFFDKLQVLQSLITLIAGTHHLFQSLFYLIISGFGDLFSAIGLYF